MNGASPATSLFDFTSSGSDEEHKGSGASGKRKQGADYGTASAQKTLAGTPSRRTRVTPRKGSLQDVGVMKPLVISPDAVSSGRGSSLSLSSSSTSTPCTAAAAAAEAKEAKAAGNATSSSASPGTAGVAGKDRPKRKLFFDDVDDALPPAHALMAPATRSESQQASSTKRRKEDKPLAWSPSNRKAAEVIAIDPSLILSSSSEDEGGQEKVGQKESISSKIADPPLAITKPSSRGRRKSGTSVAGGDVQGKGKEDPSNGKGKQESEAKERQTEETKSAHVVSDAAKPKARPQVQSKLDAFLRESAAYTESIDMDISLEVPLENANNYESRKPATVGPSSSQKTASESSLLQSITAVGNIDDSDSMEATIESPLSSSSKQLDPSPVQSIAIKSFESSEHVTTATNGVIKEAKASEERKSAAEKIATTLPLVLPSGTGTRSTSASTFLFESQQDLDLNGDVGAIGQLIGNQAKTGKVTIDLKGLLFQGQIVPTACTFLMVSMGPEHAKIDAVVNNMFHGDFQGNSLDSETVIHGVVDDISDDELVVNGDADDEENEGKTPRSKKSKKGNAGDAASAADKKTPKASAKRPKAAVGAVLSSEDATGETKKKTPKTLKKATRTSSSKAKKTPSKSPRHKKST